MQEFQIFYDYECPYCKKGYEALMELLPLYPDLRAEWIPIESHPRPEEGHPPHTDLCIEAYYIALELGADMEAFHKAMFQAVAAEKQNVENPEVLAAVLKSVTDTGKLLSALESKKYASRPAANNDLAYEKKGVWFVPAFRIPREKPEMENEEKTPKLDARGGIGVSREEIKEFLDKVNAMRLN